MCCKAIQDMIERKEKESTINLYKNGVSNRNYCKILELTNRKNSFMDFRCWFADYVKTTTTFVKSFSKWAMSLS